MVSGAAGALVLAVAATMGLHVGPAVLLGGAVWLGSRWLLPASKSAAQVLLSGGISKAKLAEILNECREHVSTLRGFARDDIRDAVFKDKVNRMCRGIDDILAFFEENPDSLQLAGAFPDYLRLLQSNLRNYVSLSDHAGEGAEYEKSLAETRAAVDQAISYLAELRGRLLQSQSFDLEAEARTLQKLLKNG